jgi:pilus assembly protein CpaB
MSPRQVIVLVVAAICAIGAIFVVRGIVGGAPQQAAETAEPIAGEQVLVAARDIPQGAALAPSDLAVALFPQNSVNQSFVRVSQQPSAQADYVGGVTRRAFVAGEPITTASVVQPEGRGFLAAQLEPGYRAVAIEISRETAAGGYIQPNDHVDVIMTQKIDGQNGNDEVRSDIVLSDIRVIAMGDQTQTQTTGEAPAQIEAVVAVLELTAEDARTLALAEEVGDVTLALRGVQVETVGMRSSSQSGVRQQGGSVRIHSYGTVAGGR